MTIKEIIDSLIDADFNIKIQVFDNENDENIVLYDGNACNLIDADYDALELEINYMFPENNKIVFEVNFEDEIEKIDNYKINI